MSLLLPIIDIIATHSCYQCNQMMPSLLTTSSIIAVDLFQNYFQFRSALLVTPAIITIDKSYHLLLTHAIIAATQVIISATHVNIAAKIFHHYCYHVFVATAC